jgi:hypothetical protein
MSTPAEQDLHQKLPVEHTDDCISVFSTRILSSWLVRKVSGSSTLLENTLARKDFSRLGDRR